MTQGSNAGATGPTSAPENTPLPEMPAAARLVKEGSVPQPQPDRVLEAAPMALQNAAWVLAGGALFPFMGSGGGFLYMLAAKAIGLIGCAMLAATVLTRLGRSAPVVGALGKVRWGPPIGGKPKNAVQGVLASVPTALHLVGLLFIVAGPLMCLFDPQIAAANERAAAAGTTSTASALKAAAEVAALLLAGCTLAHLFAYKKGGKFSPLYPFLFAGPAVMGLLSIVTQMRGSKNVIVIVGAGIVSVAAFMGLYAIGVAMVQAKKEGDAKRDEALAARRAARKSGGAAVGGKPRT